MQTYPINLTGLGGQRAVVIGGGAVAFRKVEGLLQAGASVTVIAPQIAPELAALIEGGRVGVERRPFRAGDATAAWLVIAATGDPEVNHAAAAEALAAGRLVNVVDDPGHSNFIVPAVVRRGDVTVAVSTGGDSPALARRLREGLEALLGEEIGELASLMGELRGPLLAMHAAAADRLSAALRVVDDAEVRELLAAGERAAGRDRALRLICAPEDGDA